MSDHTRDTSSELRWGIKASFVNYVLDVVPDGRIELSEGATEPRPRCYAFSFDAVRSTWRPDNPDGTARFRGSVTFTGHGGSLRTVVADPWLTFLEDALIFSLRDPRAIEHDERLIVARPAFAAPVSVGTHLLDIVLDYAALDLFLLQYSAGDALSPVEFDLSAAISAELVTR